MKYVNIYTEDQLETHIFPLPIGTTTNNLSGQPTTYTTTNTYNTSTPLRTATTISPSSGYGLTTTGPTTVTFGQGPIYTANTTKYNAPAIDSQPITTYTTTNGTAMLNQLP
jgi:hypothetical protein